LIRHLPPLLDCEPYSSDRAEPVYSCPGKQGNKVGRRVDGYQDNLLPIADRKSTLCSIIPAVMGCVDPKNQTHHMRPYLLSTDAHSGIAPNANVSDRGGQSELCGSVCTGYDHRGLSSRTSIRFGVVTRLMLTLPRSSMSKPACARGC